MKSDANIQLSVLDLAPVPSGSSSREALLNTIELAKSVDAWGFTRYWMAEHHNAQLIACSSPEILIGHIASATRNIRVGSGGVMLPNQAPLKVAESFRTLEALHPRRIDLGLGRAPGTDQLTAQALRRTRGAMTNGDDFPQQLDELLNFFSGEFPDSHPFRAVQAVPVDVETPDVWLLGSSDFSARLAAQRGLGFAFAHHINPAPAIDALRWYSGNFQPSAHLSEPRAILTVSVICADTDAEADRLATSADLALLGFYRGKLLPRLPSIEEAARYPYTNFEREIIEHNRARLFVGAPATVHQKLRLLIEQTGARELMVSTLIHNHQARLHSYELLAESFATTAKPERATTAMMV